MTKRERVDAAFKQASEEYELMDNIFQRGVLMYRKFSEIPPSCEQTFPPCGIALGIGLDQLRSSLETFLNTFGQFADKFVEEIYPEFRKIVETRQAQKAEADSKLDESEGYDKTLVDATLKRNQALFAAAKRLNELIASLHGKKSVSVKNVTAVWSQYCQALNDFLAEREALKISTDSLEMKMVKHCEQIKENEREMREEMTKRVFVPVVAGIQQMSHAIKAVADTIDRNCVCDIDADLKLLRQKGIRFCEDELPKFKRHEFSSVYYMPERMVIPQFKVEYFPLGAAVALANFTPADDNEVPLVKGRRVFLMEPVGEDQPWTMVMTCGWGKIGFVPTAYLSVTRGKLAVVNRATFKHTNPKFLQTKLPFVVMLQELAKGLWLCEDEMLMRDKVTIQHLLTL